MVFETAVWIIASHLQTFGPAASAIRFPPLHVHSFFYPWFLQGCTNRHKSKANLKNTDAAATAQRESCERHRFHGFFSLCVTVKVCHVLTWRGRFSGSWLFGTTGTASLIWLPVCIIKRHSSWSSVSPLTFLNTSCGVCGASTLSSSCLFQHPFGHRHHRRHHPLLHCPLMRSVNGEQRLKLKKYLTKK